MMVVTTYRVLRVVVMLKKWYLKPIFRERDTLWKYKLD